MISCKVFNLAIEQIEALFLGTGGPLEGKYFYHKIILQAISYWKTCTSVLGYSYISTKSAVLLISQKLDLNVFLNPSGGFETFKRSATTNCKGMGYGV